MNSGGGHIPSALGHAFWWIKLAPPYCTFLQKDWLCLCQYIWCSSIATDTTCSQPLEGFIMTVCGMASDRGTRCIDWHWRAMHTCSLKLQLKLYWPYMFIDSSVIVMFTAIVHHFYTHYSWKTLYLSRLTLIHLECCFRIMCCTCRQVLVVVSSRML